MALRAPDDSARPTLNEFVEKSLGEQLLSEDVESGTGIALKILFVIPLPHECHGRPIETLSGAKEGAPRVGAIVSQIDGNWWN